MSKAQTIPNDTKKLFLTKGTCSHTLFYILNREFGFQNECAERAADLLAAGPGQCGTQCGMLWGSTLAVGAESFRRCCDRDQAIATAITATHHIVESFTRRAHSVDCREITKCSWKSPMGPAKYFLTGKIFTCLNLADAWAPEAMCAAKQGLSQKASDVPQAPISCASEVARQMGASDEEMVTVAGFAGGIGLSGNGCGALSAALWMRTLAWCKEHPGKSPPFFKNTCAKKIITSFYEASDSKIVCHEICGQHFTSIADHATYIRNGGCAKLMTVLSQSI
jgi:hypothetical protein